MIGRWGFLVMVSLSAIVGCGTPTQSFHSKAHREIAAIEGRIGGRLGVALVDSEGQLLLSHRGDERFAMCSTFKAALAAALLAADRRGDIDMNEEFHLSVSDLVSYAPVVEAMIEVGSATSLFVMARAAVETSDNAAANLVLRAIGGPPRFTSFVRSKGDEVTRLDRFETELNENALGDPRDTTSPVAMGRLMHALLIADSANEEDKRTLQSWMKGSKTGGARIRAGLPKRWPVGDKTGTAPGGTAYNDIAIIWPATVDEEVKPIVLAIYCDRPDKSASEVNAAIAAVARVAVSRWADGH
ncbi:MAG: class A beta-lactamase [Planctomycetes bacterium]|nr:class A beta-lactamase [Planctomycetota bacterium]